MKVRATRLNISLLNLFSGQWFGTLQSQAKRKRRCDVPRFSATLFLFREVRLFKLASPNLCETVSVAIFTAQARSPLP
eukprot:m.190982 g.190982  ORF g.190982 m.190982 type:complete len:78 (-) comp15140_c0_seq4:2830-3063(-)